MNDLVKIELVSLIDIRLINLIDELNTFFIKEWGEEINDSYSNHHRMVPVKLALPHGK